MGEEGGTGERESKIEVTVGGERGTKKGREDGVLGNWRGWKKE